MTKIGFIQAAGKPEMTIYYDKKATVNPYRVYIEWYDGTRHKKLLAKYADLFSCGCMVQRYTEMYNEERGGR